MANSCYDSSFCMNLIKACFCIISDYTYIIYIGWIRIRICMDPELLPESGTRKIQSRIRNKSFRIHNTGFYTIPCSWLQGQSTTRHSTIHSTYGCHNASSWRPSLSPFHTLKTSFFKMHFAKGQSFRNHHTKDQSFPKALGQRPVFPQGLTQKTSLSQHIVWNTSLFTTHYTKDHCIMMKTSLSPTHYVKDQSFPNTLCERPVFPQHITMKISFSLMHYMKEYSFSNT